MTSSIEDQFRQKVKDEIDRLRKYYRNQTRWYRFLRLVAVGGAATVPVLAGFSSWPRGVLGIFGALAAVAEAVQQMYQFRPTSLLAMGTANRLERELNAYVMGIKHYAVPRPESHTVFAERIEAIRCDADAAFLGIWQTAPKLSAGEQVPKQPPSA